MRRHHRGVGFEVDLVEYERLKEEQLNRIGVRDNLLYAALAAFGGVAALSVGGETARYPLLLLLPPVCVVLGWTYLVNDQRVSAIGSYVRDSLAPRLGTASGTDPLRWEELHRTDVGRRRRKTFQLGIDVLTFCVSGLTALVVFWLSAPEASGVLLVVSVLETVPLVMLTAEIVRCSPAGRAS